MCQHSQFPVDIKSLISAHLHLAHAIAADLGVLDRRVEFVAPWAAVAVSVAVVVAQQVVTAGFLAAAHFERLVHGCEQFFFVFRD